MRTKTFSKKTKPQCFRHPMLIYKNNDVVPWDKCVATVGFFDGVHGGHRFLLHEVATEAHKQHTTAVVITFDTHPQKALQHNFHPRLLSTTDEKLNLLAATGMDACVILDFTTALSQLSAKEFIEKILAEKLRVSTLFVGHDHRFGRHREEGFDEYSTYGKAFNMRVIQAEKFTTTNESKWSSSHIRRALTSGNLALANELLTYPYAFPGKVVSGYKNGRTIGFPTANIQVDDEEKIVPGAGVYAVYAHVGGERYKAMMNIGYRPTFSTENKQSIEVHIIDFNGDIYGKHLKITCMYRLRDEKRFNNIDELTEQLKKDRMQANNLL